jgi:hypothetical protein
MRERKDRANNRKDVIVCNAGAEVQVESLEGRGGGWKEKGDDLHTSHHHPRNNATAIFCVCCTFLFCVVSVNEFLLLITLSGIELPC